MLVLLVLLVLVMVMVMMMIVGSRQQISWFRKLDDRLNLLFLMTAATLALNVALLVAICSAR